MEPLNAQFPAKVVPVLFQPSRYKDLHGGRGSAKSWSVAKASVLETAFRPLRYLCTREMQNSIRDSVYRLITDMIVALGFQSYFNVQRDYISSIAGAEFLFKGLRHNISEIKSTEGIDRCWVEEAEKVSEDSWQILIPTIRKENSEIITTWNPEDERSATYQRFVLNKPPDCLSAEMNYMDNPWFPDVLRREMEYDKRVDFEKYQHVWLGKTKKYGQTCIFKNWVVESFPEPDPLTTEFYFGADFGFSNDPSVLGRMFIKDRCLFIDYEAYGVGVELDDLEKFYDSVPGSRKWKIVADSERPDTIAYLRKRGFNIVGAQKGKGSVEDGTVFLQGFERIVIHPRCPGAKKDFSNYRLKTDRITQEVLPIPAPGSDHWPDAARYGLERYIKAKASIYDVLGVT